LIDEQRNYFNTKEKIDSVEGAEYHIETLAHHTVECQHIKDTRFKELKDTAAELYREKFENSKEIQAIEADKESQFKDVFSLAEAKKKVLNQELANQKAINDNLCKEFAAAVKVFLDWLNEKKRVLSANKTTSLEQQLQELEQSTSDHNTVKQKLDNISAIDTKVANRKITTNPYTNVTSPDCRAMWAQYELLIRKKRELLEQQIEEQKKSGLTDEQLQEIKDNFAYFDRNKSGFLDRRELRSCLQSLGEDATPQQVDSVLKEYDLDRDNQIGFSEFQKFMFKQLGDTNTIDEIQQAFKYLSLDKDYIKKDELDAVVNELSFKTRHVDYLKKEMKPKTDGYDWPRWTKEVLDR